MRSGHHERDLHYIKYKENKMIKEFQKIKIKNRKDILTDEEIERLIILGEIIQANLSCDINGEGLPCRTDRLSAVQLMKEYLSIHKEK